MDKQNLFVNEDEDLSDNAASDQIHDRDRGSSPVKEPKEDDDPIVRSIPMIHSSLPDRQSQSLHVFQFTNRPQSQSFHGHRLDASVKPSSKVVQIKTPIDTSRFYDDSRAEELGTRVENVSLQGVFARTNGNLYVAKLVGDGEQQKLVLLPLDSTAQLRPSFKYIDDHDAARSAQLRQDASSPDTVKSAAVQVLQTTSKPNPNTADGQFTGGMGSCLRHVKKFNEEEWRGLVWSDDHDSATTALRKELQSTSDGPVETSTFLDELL